MSARYPASDDQKGPVASERTLLYRTVCEHFETWLELRGSGQFDGQGDHHTPSAYVRQAFRKYLECAIFAHGFARAWCDDCGHGCFVAFSRKVVGSVRRATPGAWWRRRRT